MKLRKNTSPIWLSEITQQIIHKEYPQLVSLRTHDSWTSKLGQNVPKSIRVVLIIFVVGVVLNEFFIWQEWIFSTYDLDSQRAADVLASSLEYLAGLVGIVLPIVLIIVEFVSKDRGASSLVDIYLEKTNLKTTAIWALTLLAIEATLMAIFRANIVKNAPLILYAIFLFTLLNLAVIFETGMTIWNLRRSLSNTFLVETLLEKLKFEIKRSQKIEVEYRISRIANVELFQQFGLERNLGEQQPQNTIALLATKTGSIEDIQLPVFHKFIYLVATSPEMAHMTKLVHDTVQENKPIAYLSSTMNERVEELQRTLNESYKLGKGKKTNQVNDNVKTLLTQVKQTVETSIKEENKLFFDELMPMYRQIFELGIHLPLPPSTEWLSDFLFRGWSANTIAIWHLRDFIETAARSKNREFIDSLSYEILKIASLMIENSHKAVDPNLTEILGLYIHMYYFSYRHENDLGVNRSYFYLTRDIVDRIWSSSLENLHKDIQAVKNHYEILNHILGTLSRILKQSLLNHDLDTFSLLLNSMKPDELLAHFSLRHSFFHDYDLLLQKLGESSESEKQDIYLQIEALRLVENISDHAQRYFDNFVTLLAAYICEGYEKDEITINQFESFLSILEPYLPSIEKTVRILSELVNNGGLIGWDLFTRHPDTKRGYFPNSEDKTFLFYCLRGMHFLSKEEVNITLSLNLSSHLSRIEETSNRIAEASAKWLQTSLFASIDRELLELARSWVALNETINQRWQDTRDTQIIESELDSEKITIFKEALESAIEEASQNSYRTVLASYGKVTYGETLKNQIQDRQFGEKLYFTQLYEDDNFARELGRLYGNSIVRGGDNYLIHYLVQNSRNLPTSKKWDNLQPYFDRAINQFNNNTYKVSCFLVPHNRHLFRWLQCTPNFVEHYRLEIAGISPMVEGLYYGIPVYEYFPRDNDVQYVLALDLEKAVELRIGDPRTEIRTLTEEEIRQILDSKPDRVRKELLLRIVVEASQPFDIEALDRKAIVRMQLKLPANERSIFVD